jgi:hypothetical protein
LEIPFERDIDLQETINFYIAVGWRQKLTLFPKTRSRPTESPGMTLHGLQAQLGQTLVKEGA